MKNYKTLLWIVYILSVLSIVVGIIAKMSGFGIFNLDALSYYRFSIFCLLFIISLGLVQLTLTKKE